MTDKRAYSRELGRPVPEGRRPVPPPPPKPAFRSAVKPSPCVHRFVPLRREPALGGIGWQEIFYCERCLTHATVRNGQLVPDSETPLPALSPMTLTLQDIGEGDGAAPVKVRFGEDQILVTLHDAEGDTCAMVVVEVMDGRVLVDYTNATDYPNESTHIDWLVDAPLSKESLRDGDH